MKKMLIILFSCLLVVSAMASGNKDTSESGKTKLTMLAHVDKTDPTNTGNFDDILNEFYAQNPDVELDIEYLWNEPYHNKLQVMSVAGQLPDLMFLWPGKRTGQITGSGKIKNIESFISTVKDEFAVSAVAAQGLDGEMYELPEQVTATHVMYTNNQILEELGLEFPKTFKELLAQSPVILEAGYIPIAMDNGDGWQMQSCFLSVLVERLIGKADLQKMVKGDLHFTDDRFTAALQVIKDLYDAEMFSPGINQAGYGIALTDFVNSKAVYFIDGGWRTTNLSAEMDVELQDSITFEVFPELSAEIGLKGSTSIVAGTGYGMNADLTPEEAEKAWAWIYFFAGGNGGAEIKFAQGTLPAMTSFNLPSDSPIMQKRLADFLGNTPGGYVIDAMLDGEGMGILQSAIQEMMFGQKTAKEVAAEYETWVDSNDSGRTE